MLPHYIICNKMEKKKYHTIKRKQSNLKTVKMETKSVTITHIHDRSFFPFDTGTLIK